MSQTPAAELEEPVFVDDAAAEAVLARARFRLETLEELAVIGLDLARALRDRVTGAVAAEAADDESAPALGKSDPAAAYAQISRGVRLTLALHKEIDEALAAFLAGRDEACRRRRLIARTAAKEAADAAHEKRREDIHYLVLGAATRDVVETADWDHLDVSLEEHLMLDEPYWADPNRPLREIVERLCAYFELSPDWSRWGEDGWRAPDVADEPWPWAARRNAPQPPSPTAASPPRAHALE